MLFQGKDGELRIFDKGTGGVDYYFQVLFCEMDLDAPISRPRTEEELIMDRNQFDSNSHYIEKDDQPRYAPIPITFSCRLADTVDTRALSDWLAGATNIPNAVGGTTRIYSWGGSTTIDGNTTADFADDGKMRYRVEMILDGTNDLGYQYNEVYFTPGEQKITESADNVMLSGNGQIYGDVTRITAWWTAATKWS